MMSRSALWVNTLFLSLAGVWPPTSPTGRCLYLLLHSSVLLCIQVAVLGTELMAIHAYWGDLNSLTLNVCAIATFSLSLSKLVLFLARPSRARAVVTALDDLVAVQRGRGDAETTQILDSSLRKARIMSVGYMSFLYVANTAWTMFPLLELAMGLSEERALPVVSWLPYNATVSPNYEATYAVQFVTLASCAAIIISTDLFFFTMASHLTVQLRILRMRLQRLGPGTGDQERMYRELVDCIQHHQAIISLAGDMENLMNAMILPQYVADIIAICFTLFQFLEKTHKATVFKCVLYLSAATFQMFLYCVFAHEVMEESTLVSKAAYSCDWVGAIGKVMRSLWILMSRCQKPLTFTAGKFYPISRGTFVTLINASYSYYALLSHFNKR